MTCLLRFTNFVANLIFFGAIKLLFGKGFIFVGFVNELAGKRIFTQYYYLRNGSEYRCHFVTYTVGRLSCFQIKILSELILLVCHVLVKPINLSRFCRYYI